jgi:putative oxidoreductase
MIKVGKVARLTLGLLLLLFGIHGLTGFMGERMLPLDASEALNHLQEVGFILPFLSILAVISGILMLTNVLVPIGVAIGLILIVAVIIFHIQYHLRGIMFAAIAFIAAIVVIYDYKDLLKGIARRDETAL